MNKNNRGYSISSCGFSRAYHANRADCGHSGCTMRHFGAPAKALATREGRAFVQLSDSCHLHLIEAQAIQAKHEGSALIMGSGIGGAVYSVVRFA